MKALKIGNHGRHSCDECKGTPPKSIWMLISAGTGNYLHLCSYCLYRTKVAITKKEKYIVADASEDVGG